jgi:hypothetical protein
LFIGMARLLGQHSPDDSETVVNNSAFLDSLEPDARYGRVTGTRGRTERIVIMPTTYGVARKSLDFLDLSEF